MLRLFYAFQAGVALCALVPGIAVAQAPGSSSSLLRQVASVLDYVASDYAGAVSAQGVVIDDAE